MLNRTRSIAVLALIGSMSLAPQVAEARTYRRDAFGYRLRYNYGYYPFWYGSAAYAPAYGYGYYAYPATDAPPAGPALVVSVGAEAQANAQGGALGGSFALEGDRWGFNAQATGVLTGNSSGFVETTSLVNGYATYALLADPRGRIRIEGGVSSAFAQNLILVGPSFGFSGAVGIIGPFGLDAQIHGTPIPYRELDWSAGGTVAIGPVGLRAGWRQIYLNDMGFGGTGVHEDLFSGPYVGLGLSL